MVISFGNIPSINVLPILYNVTPLSQKVANSSDSNLPCSIMIDNHFDIYWKNNKHFFSFFFWKSSLRSCALTSHIFLSNLKSFLLNTSGRIWVHFYIFQKYRTKFSRWVIMGTHRKLDIGLHIYAHKYIHTLTHTHTNKQTNTQSRNLLHTRKTHKN